MGGDIYDLCKYKTKYIYFQGKEAVADIKRTTNSQDVLFFPLDLLNLKSVREFSEEIMKHVDKIDILLNNAGFADGRKERVGN